MTEKSDMDVVETYDIDGNEEDFLNFSDLDGNPPKDLSEAERNELFPSVFIPYKNKTVEIYHEAQGYLWKCRFVEGGELPAAMRGRFTTDTEAAKVVKMEAIKVEE